MTGFAESLECGRAPEWLFWQLISELANLALFGRFKMRFLRGWRGYGMPSWLS